MIQSRNIFDPSRQPIRPASAPRPQTAPVTRADYAALTGTLVTADKQLAFFSGSRADFNKVLPVNGSIAGWKITRITTGDVELDRGDGKKSVITIGQALPLSGGASSAAPAAPSGAASSQNAAASQAGGQPPFEAGASTNPANPANPASAENPANPAAPAAAPAGASSSRDELIKRMMQRRQQETSK